MIKGVPEFCPKCGVKVSLYFRGEPVFLCSNKDCKAYYDVMGFTEKSSLNINDLKNINLNETSIDTGDKLIFFNEDAIDSRLYMMLYLLKH